MTGRRASLAGAALLAVAAIVPAVLLQATDFDFVYGRDRDRQRALALLALAIPLAAALAARGLGLGARAAALADGLCARWRALPAAAKALFPLGVLAAAVAVGVGVLQRFPNSADEYAYLFQAETYARGGLWVEPDPLQDVLHVMHAKVIDGKWVSRFPPGWPLALAPWLRVGVPAWLVNGSLAAAALALLYTFGRRECGERGALVACAGVALSPFWLLNGGSYFSHPFAALVGLAFADAASRYLERPALGPALAAGVALGILGVTRQLSAALWLAPFAAVLLGRRSLPHLARLWPLPAAAGAFLAGLLLYNQAITGDQLMPPTVVDDPNQGLGFSGKHTPERALRFMEKRALLLSHYTSPLLVALWAMAVVRAARRRELRFWDAYFPLALAGYALYRNDAHNQYGPRYLFEAFPFVALRVGAALAPARGEAFRPLAACLTLAYVAGTAANLPGTLALHHRIVWERRDPYRLAAEAELRDAVVFLASDSGVRQRMPAFDLVRNGLDADRREVVFAHWREDRVGDVVARWPSRSLWVYRRDDGQVRGRLERLAAPAASRTGSAR